MFSHRVGKLSQATGYLKKARKFLRGQRGQTDSRERLRVEAELAEIESNKGEYSKADAFCRGALRSLARCKKARKNSGVLHEQMVLLETLAHLQLRRFAFAEAKARSSRACASLASSGTCPRKASFSTT